MPITVADMAKAGCTTARGIRYWEQEGLLGEVDRSTGKQRTYTEAQLDRARIIAAAKFAGFDLDTTRQMLEAYDTEAYEAVLHRLVQQASLAGWLAEELPMPREKQSTPVYDL